jgi:hypothetical protein
MHFDDDHTMYLSFAIRIILRESGLKFETEKKCVAYPQEDFLFTTDARLCKILKKCLFEQFFQIPEILKFQKKVF